MAHFAKYVPQEATSQLIGMPKNLLSISATLVDYAISGCIFQMI
jgi:hypothetical protein